MKPTAIETLRHQNLSAIRQKLHRQPELSGQEFQTAGKLAGLLRQLQPSLLLEGIGGTGLIALFDSGKQGPTLLFRSELDALRRSRKKVFQAPPMEWIEERLCRVQEVLERRHECAREL